MFDPFEEFLTDTLTLRKAGETVRENIKASVQQNGIFINDATLHIEPGDTLSRALPNGVVEDLVVEDAHYTSEWEDMPGSWKVKYHRKTRLPAEPRAVTYSATGPNARINIHSHDQSTNIARADSLEFFLEFRYAVREQIAQEVERDALIERIEG